MTVDLLVPVKGNHNATLFLLNYAIEHPGKYQLLLLESDVVADRRVAQLCLWLGVKVVTTTEIVGASYRRIFVHPWNTESHPTDEVNFEELWIYADGLSNRVTAKQWPQATGFLFWGDRAPMALGSNVSGQEISLSPIHSMKTIWQKLRDDAGLKHSKNRMAKLEGTTLIAMRYWGSSTYSAVSQIHVAECLSQIQKASDSQKILVKLDTRWTLPFSQMQLIRKAFPGRQIGRLSNSRSEQASLGHLASLDTLAFTTEFPEMYFYGFDGSLPPTMIAMQPKAKVLVPRMDEVLNPKIPIQKVILENFEWHRSLLGEQEECREFPSLFQSESLWTVIQQSRGAKIVNDEELGAIARSLLDEEAANAAPPIATRLQIAVTRTQHENSKRKIRSGLKRAITSSPLALKIFYKSSKFLPLRKLLVALSRRL